LHCKTWDLSRKLSTWFETSIPNDCQIRYAPRAPLARRSYCAAGNGRAALTAEFAEVSLSGLSTSAAQIAAATFSNSCRNSGLKTALK
jgi:hypothetical protein